MENESCRILTISSTIEEAATFIESVKALAASRSSSTLSPSSPPEILSVPLTIPWTIANRYYVADVHFSAWTTDRFFPDLLEWQPPAIVFVWSEGQPYVKHAKEIARLMKLQEYEPEVALAVRIPCTHNSAETEDEGEDENSDIDGMLLSCGFEYVDATRSEGEDGMEDDIPALPRVLDALSTIIWPSMRPNKVEPGGPKIPLDLNQSFDTIDSEDDELEREKETMLQELLRESLSGGDEDEDDGEVGENDDDDDDDQDFVAQMKAVILETAMKREWERNRPWISVSGSSSTTATMTESPIEETVRDGEEGVPDKEKEALRFEDDFSGFVSAPEETDAGFSYRTLGSVSDFGECDTGEIFEELDAYKSKISAIEDEQEKRMKAAQIALGVVYGL